MVSSSDFLVPERIRYWGEKHNRENRFFNKALACTTIPTLRLIPFCRSWYEITWNFGLSINTFPAMLARALKEDRGEWDRKYEFHSKQTVEDVLVVVSEIAGNDLGVGLGLFQNPTGHSGIHYNMFAEMVSPILSIAELSDPYHSGLVRATDPIVSTFWESFQSLEKGVAVLCVIEQSALSIINAMKALFLAVENAEGRKIFPIDSLQYITLHQKIESAHAQKSLDIATLVNNTRDQMGISGHVQSLYQKFDRFWNALEKVTF